MISVISQFGTQNIVLEPSEHPGLVVAPSLLLTSPLGNNGMDQKCFSDVTMCESFLVSPSVWKPGHYVEVTGRLLSKVCGTLARCSRTSPSVDCGAAALARGHNWLLLGGEYWWIPNVSLILVRYVCGRLCVSSVTLHSLLKPVGDQTVQGQLGRSGKHQAPPHTGALTRG